MSSITKQLLMASAIAAAVVLPNIASAQWGWNPNFAGFPGYGGYPGYSGHPGYGGFPGYPGNGGYPGNAMYGVYPGNGGYPGYDGYPVYAGYPENNGYRSHRAYPGNPMGNESWGGGAGNSAPAYGYGPDYGRGDSNSPLNDEIGGWIGDWFSKNGRSHGAPGHNGRGNNHWGP